MIEINAIQLNHPTSITLGSANLGYAWRCWNNDTKGIIGARSNQNNDLIITQNDGIAVIEKDLKFVSHPDFTIQFQIIKS